MVGMPLEIERALQCLGNIVIDDTISLVILSLTRDLQLYKWHVLHLASAMEVLFYPFFSNGSGVKTPLGGVPSGTRNHAPQGRFDAVGLVSLSFLLLSVSVAYNNKERKTRSMNERPSSLIQIQSNHSPPPLAWKPRRYADNQQPSPVDESEKKVRSKKASSFERHASVTGCTSVQIPGHHHRTPTIDTTVVPFLGRERGHPRAGLASHTSAPIFHSTPNIQQPILPPRAKCRVGSFPSAASSSFHLLLLLATQANPFHACGLPSPAWRRKGADDKAGGLCVAGAIVLLMKQKLSCSQPAFFSQEATIISPSVGEKVTEPEVVIFVPASAFLFAISFPAESARGISLWLGPSSRSRAGAVELLLVGLQITNTAFHHFILRLISGLPGGRMRALASCQRAFIGERGFL
ncbi:uncharacterized protein CLUP02_00867 [Colletotrichum lupini]|uniref:Uncharacterized protein n=1 Tax=Colletotrichum lupini TaxID=145971 RepID=A0A9Q8SBK8_9PEZI|nr:uncharacterized protein CLUP02_00867 [Colletotrichum lupini]UQC74219.1 hypothetical protein CLUP02_00867 [Colletotrichum lupini]